MKPDIINKFAFKETPLLANDQERIVFRYLDETGRIRIPAQRRREIRKHLEPIRQHLLARFTEQVTCPDIYRPNMTSFERYDYRTTNEVYAQPFQSLAVADRDNHRRHPAIKNWRAILAIADELFDDRLISQYRRHLTICIGGDENVIPEIRYSMAAILATLDFLTNPPEILAKIKKTRQQIRTDVYLTREKTGSHAGQIDAIVSKHFDDPFDVWEYLSNRPRYNLLELKSKFRVPEVRNDGSLSRPIPDDLRQINQKLSNIAGEFNHRFPDKEYVFPDYLFLLYLRFPTQPRTFEIPFDTTYLENWVREIKNRRPDSPDRHYLLRTIRQAIKK